MPLQPMTLPADEGDSKAEEHCDIGLPRLMQKDALVLCGIDIPERVNEGLLRVIVALKRVWHDAPADIALIVRDTLPTGERRAAAVYRTLGEEAEAVGLEVPMTEAGLHVLTVQVAKKIDGELVEVFLIEDRLLHVENPPAPNFGESRGLCLRGIDCPTVVKDGMLRCIVALERLDLDSPVSLALIARNRLPDGTTRAAVVRRYVEDLVFTLGIEVPLTEAGDHSVELIVAEDVEGSLVPIFVIPNRSVFASNPPMPRLMESGSVVLCGVDICGTRFPWSSYCNAPYTAPCKLNATVALARTWDDAPKDFALLIRCVAENGECKSAIVRRDIKGLIPATIGLEAPLEAAGTYVITAYVLADLGNGEHLEEVFALPSLTLNVSAALKSREIAHPTFAIEPVSIKIALVDAGNGTVIRRFTFPTAERFVSDGMFDELISAVRSSFRLELSPASSFRLTYTDDEGDDVVVSSDSEVVDALALHHLHHRRNSDASGASSAPGRALRMSLTRV